MFIVMKDGPKKGEVQEMKYFVARDLINAGRAELYVFEEKKAQEVLTLADDIGPSQPTEEKSKKKKGKK
jgi:hypothetical protein